jgi:hypothetical protein
MAPVTRRQAQEYWSKHYPQTSSQNYEYVRKTLDFYKQQKPTPTDNILWEWFQGSFSHWSLHNFHNLAPSIQEELRAYLRCGGVYVRPNDKGPSIAYNQASIAQALYEAANEDKQHMWSNDDIKECKPDLQKGPITSIWITPNRDLRLPPPFASFDQEAIPLRLQHKELPEERQERLRQERQKRVQQQQQKRPQNQPEERQERRQKRQQNRPQNRPKAQPAPKSRCLPQPSTCQRCKEDFNSRNALFRHLKLCKTSRSRASSVTSKSSASSVSSRVSRASSTASSTSSVSSASSTSSIASIEKLQLQILGQLYAIRTQDLSFLRKNDPLYGSPQNRQLRKSTAASPPKSTATYRQLSHPQNRQLRKSTAVTTPQKPSVTQSTTDTPSPVESNTPEAPESTVNAVTAITTTAVPHTLAPLTANNPWNPTPLKLSQ